MKKHTKKSRGLKLYYLDCCLKIQRDNLDSKDSQALLQKHADWVIGVYDASALLGDIKADAEVTKNVLLQKRAA